MVLQRPHEVELARRWTGRRPGIDVPAVYVEHNTPDQSPTGTLHPLADRADVPIAHVTHFNRLMWDNGRAPSTVVEHGIPDPGPLWTGELPRAAVVVNDPLPRGRVVGTDLLPGFARTVPLDVFGMRTAALADRDRVTAADLPQAELHPAMARRRLYLHPVRWTSLGLSLLEAMLLGMPVVALETTAVREAVPSGAGVVSNRPEALRSGIRVLLADRERARELGQRARTAALARYRLSRFLSDWERLIKEVTR